MIACIATVACGGSKPPMRVTSPAVLTFLAPAAQYNEPTNPPPSTSLGDVLLAQVNETAARAGRNAPVPDQRLFLASKALAGVLPEDGYVSYPLAQFALTTSGVIEPWPHVLVVWGFLYEPRGGGIPDALQPALDEIFREDAITHVGVGAVVRGRLGYGAVVLTLLSSRIRTSPIPRAVPADGAIDFEVTVQPTVAPFAAVIRPTGLVDAVELERKGDGVFTAHLECAGAPGKMPVEILTDDQAGDPTLARFPIWCGTAPPRSYRVQPPVAAAPVEPATAERQVFALVNRERARLGRAPLVWDDGLARIARDHSQDMSRVLVVSHRVPDGKSIEERVRATRDDVRVVGAVGRAFDASEAHQELMDLPSTRIWLIANGATQIGIGIAYGRTVVGETRELYITEIVAVPKRDRSHW